jgi:low affinity Fe/Cu permease
VSRRRTRRGTTSPLGQRDLNELFRRFAQTTSHAVGSAWAFVVAAAVIVVWVLTGPLFGFSDTWQLVINTGTTIVTFLMVFLIQNTQNRDAKAIHLKLDELLRGVEGARTDMVDLEDCTDEELARYEAEFRRIRDLRRTSPELAGRTAQKIAEAEGSTSPAAVVAEIAARRRDDGSAGA